MITALTLPTENDDFCPNYFYPYIFLSPEFYASPHSCSSDLMDPNQLLKSLNLETKYLETPPFCYIRSYAPIWEYFLVALYMQFQPKHGVDDSLYQRLRDKPSKNFKYFGRGYHAAGFASFSRWKDSYLKRFDNPPPKEKNSLNKLAKSTKPFVEQLINRRLPLRQYDLSENAFRKNRKIAAKSFLFFLIKNQLDDKFAKQLIGKNEFEQLNDLLDHFEENSDSYKHILSVSILLCLYGHQDGWITKSFCEKTCRRIEKLPLVKEKNQKIRNSVVKSLHEAVRGVANNTWIRPPLAFIYKERDQISIQKRISSWLHLLKDTINAENY